MDNEADLPIGYQECARDICRTLESQYIGKVNKARVEVCIGEIEYAREKTDFIKQLEDLGIVKDVSLRDESVEESYFTDDEEFTETFHIQYVEMTVNVKKLYDYLTPLSLYPRFYIEMNPSTYQLTLNGEIKIRKPQDGWLLHFWQLVTSMPNQHITGEVLISYLRSKIGTNFAIPKRGIRHTLDNYKLTGALQKLFFPIASKDNVLFHNPVLQKDIEQSRYSEKQVELSLKKLKEKS